MITVGTRPDLWHRRDRITPLRVAFRRTELVLALALTIDLHGSDGREIGRRTRVGSENVEQDLLPRLIAGELQTHLVTGLCDVGKRTNGRAVGRIDDQSIPFDTPTLAGY